MKNLYSLWFSPSVHLKKSLGEIILKLAQKYQSPQFETHMTLLGDISLDKKSVIKKAVNLSSKIKPLNLELSEVSFSTTYFQSVFIRIKPTAELMEANLKAKKIFKVDNNVFMPHISLLYDNFKMKLREKIASEIKIPENKYFKAEKIIVVPSTQNPAEWKHLTEISL